MSKQLRKHQRIPFEDATILKMVQTTNPEKMDVGKTLMCSIVNISVKGVCVYVPSELPFGSRMEVWVKSKEQQGTLKIRGKVIWCRAQEGAPGFQAGFEIRESENTDFMEFQKRIVKMLLPPSLERDQEG